MNYLDNVQLKRQELADQKADKNEKVTQIVHEKQLNEAVTKAIHESHEDNKKHRESTTLKVKIENPEVGVNNLPDLALREDINKLVNAIQSMDVKPEAVEFDPVVSALNELGSKLDTLPRQFPEIEKVEEVSVNNLSELKDFIKPVADAISKLDLKPVVNIEKEEQKEIDLSPLLTAIENLGSKLNTLEVPELDIEPLITSTNKVTSAINSLSFPVPNYVLPFKDVEGRAVQVQLDADGKLPVDTTATYYESRNDTTTDTNLVYLGKALPGSDVTDAAWQIKRYNKSTGHMSFADDVTTFTKQWSGRTTYGY